MYEELKRMQKRKILTTLIAVLFSLLLTSCQIDMTFSNSEVDMVTPIEELERTDIFLPGAVAHILEGEINAKGEAVGFHYDKLDTKKGEIMTGTETDPDEFGVYEAKVIVENVEKTSNSGYSTFFPDDWDSQEVIDAINDAYAHLEHIHGNTYEGLTKDGMLIRMYLTEDERIISAFPLYDR